VTQTHLVDADRRRRYAASLLLITSVLWLHEWLPALLVAAWVAWLVLHARLEGDLGTTLVRLWRRAWPPGSVVLTLLLAANALLYWLYAPIPGKIMPIALNLLGLSMVLGGGWWTRLTHRERPERLPRAPAAPAGAPEPLAR
jgi:hypothetical protein